MKTLLLLTPVLALSLSACGSSSKKATEPSQPAVGASASVAAATEGAAATTKGTTTKGGLPDACGLLGTDAVSRALGVTVLPGQATVQPKPIGGNECIWTTAGPPISDFQLVVRSDDTISAGSEDAAALYAQTKTTFQSFEGWVDLPGVGDKAIIGKDRAQVLKGSRLLDISIALRDPAVAKTALTTLTTEAAAKI